MTARRNVTSPSQSAARFVRVSCSVFVRKRISKGKFLAALLKLLPPPPHRNSDYSSSPISSTCSPSVPLPQYIAVPCPSVSWVPRQGTGRRPPRKIQTVPRRQNFTNSDPVFCKKWLSARIRGKTFISGPHGRSFGRQNRPFSRNRGPFSGKEGRSRGILTKRHQQSLCFGAQSTEHANVLSGKINFSAPGGRKVAIFVMEDLDPQYFGVSNFSVPPDPPYMSKNANMCYF